jgi:hypothetical protein
MKYSVSLHFSYHRLRTKENSAMIFFSDAEDYLIFDDQSDQSGKAYSLAKLPEIQDIKMSLAPDDLGILFDQVLTTANPLAANDLTTDSGATIVGSRIWLLIPPTSERPKTQSEVKALPLMGYRPQWMP